MPASVVSQPLSGLNGPLDPARSIVLVVGSGPRAEQEDRPIAYALARRFEAALANLMGPRLGGWGVWVLSDLWVMNQPDLSGCPIVCIGGPGNCAMSASLLARFTEVYAVDDRCAVHAEGDLSDLAAVCWGVDSPSTAEAAEWFARSLLDRFVATAVSREA